MTMSERRRLPSAHLWMTRRAVMWRLIVGGASPTSASGKPVGRPSAAARTIWRLFSDVMS